MNWHLYIIGMAAVVTFAVVSGFLQRRIGRRHQKKQVRVNEDLVAIGIQILLGVAAFIYVLLLRVTGALWFDLGFALLAGAPLAIYGAGRSLQRYREGKKKL
jgi:hypothetical protein